jgi:hypothetical protein
MLIPEIAHTVPLVARMYTRPSGNLTDETGREITVLAVATT